MYVTLIICTPLLFLFYPLILHISIPIHVRIIKLNYIRYLTSVFIYFILSKRYLLQELTGRKRFSILHILFSSARHTAPAA